jgi:hypothetical protein
MLRRVDKTARLGTAIVATDRNERCHDDRDLEQIDDHENERRRIIRIAADETDKAINKKPANHIEEEQESTRRPLLPDEMLPVRLPDACPCPLDLFGYLGLRRLGCLQTSIHGGGGTIRLFTHSPGKIRDPNPEHSVERSTLSQSPTATFNSARLYEAAAARLAGEQRALTVPALLDTHCAFEILAPLGEISRQAPGNAGQFSQAIFSQH